MVTVSDSTEFKSFLLIMCLDAREFTIKFSFDLKIDYVDKHHFSEGANNAVSCFSSFFFFGQLPRCFTGTSLLSFRLFLRSILKFRNIGVTLMKINHLGKSLQAMDCALHVNMT